MCADDIVIYIRLNRTAGYILDVVPADIPPGVDPFHVFFASKTTAAFILFRVKTMVPKCFMDHSPEETALCFDAGKSTVINLDELPVSQYPRTFIPAGT